MLELGADEEKFHRDLADHVIAAGISGVITYGTRMKWLHNELKDERHFKGKISHHQDLTSASAAITQLLSKPVAILAKGSRGMQLERLFSTRVG